ncbi:MAG TPA: branched-chain amino acid ABC transporter permease [Bacillota bacterium]|jgi:branched-chain amino acid transport system permease protein|nr:branched-chain amino acid ABC transporter permease [Bacillota bacterium]HNY67428.1 branched-chain amino acid ABC transporter permease [Bacillota bacterium]HOI36280.1 branched-chain amino acid ABC transporter permease [Bacillota bacterium]HPU74768.1 branched-chain amino acid ABC transporter permease [Bacillota bacterium]
MLLQQVIQGLAIGSVYGLLALGYVLMWQAWGVMDFARGDGAMVGAFYLLIFSQFKGLNIVLAFILAVGASALTGFVVERIAYRPILGGRDINRLIATIGVGMFTRNLYRVMFGADPFPFPSVFGDNPIHVGKLIIVPQNLWITAIGFGLAYLLRLFLAKSWMGKAMRATAQDRETAALMGIKVKNSMTFTFVLATVIGGIAGMLIAPLYFVMADMGALMGIKGYASAVLGGLDSMSGAMVGGLILGLAENLAGGFISSGYQTAIAFLIMILVLIFRPQGIMGRRQ